MKSSIFQKLKELTELPGMAGFEAGVNQWLHHQWQPYVKDIRFSATGNLITEYGGSGPKLLVEAHADEVGFVVKCIDEAGYIWIEPGNPYLVNPGKEVFVIGQPALIQTSASENIHGFFAAISGHAAPTKLLKRPHLDWNDIFIDIGVNRAENVLEKGIGIGDSVLWNPITRQIGQHITGKAMDDRAGLCVITELLQRLHSEKLHHSVYFSSSVQEEMGLVGASSLHKNVDFDLALTLDIVPAGDIPGIVYKDISIKLGQGPVLVHHDTSVHYHRALIQSLARIAKDNGIPVQHAVLSRYGSNGAELIRSGIPSALIGLPTRYTHSPFETIDEFDLEQCIKLLELFLCSKSI